jgi:hypothetical protein
MLRALLFFFLLVAAAQAAQMKPEEAVAVQTALDRGTLLYEVDRAAWVTTDDMLARLGEEGAAGIRGWTVEPDGALGAFLVTYYGDSPAGPVALYSGKVRDGKVASSELHPEGARPPLTALQLRLKQAADTARAFDEYEPCTPARFNLAVIPPANAAGPIEAYLLSAQTERGVYPAGGHYRLTIADGKVVSNRRFTKSCLNLDTTAQGDSGAPAALVMSHLLDPTPTEIHVFLSMSAGKPVYVMTGKTLWVVEGPRIRILNRD